MIGKIKILLVASDIQLAYPTDDVSSSFFERVIVIIDTCLVVSSLQREKMFRAQLNSSKSKEKNL